jgi:hypothetical protein
MNHNHDPGFPAVNSKKSNNLVNASNSDQPQSQANGAIEYNPLTGVSVKPTHSSDVEIVGVKLGQGSNSSYSNLNQDITNPIKKRVSNKSKIATSSTKSYLKFYF